MKMNVGLHALVEPSHGTGGKLGAMACFGCLRICVVSCHSVGAFISHGPLTWVVCIRHVLIEIWCYVRILRNVYGCCSCRLGLIGIFRGHPWDGILYRCGSAS